MTTLELLSPARNLECGISAIDHGADAVYIGAQKFGARAAAGNSIEDIYHLCRYAHQFDAKVYVTVNTIIYDDEMQETIELVKQICSVGADAILIQDMGLIYELAKQKLNIPIHASTQTDNRTVEKVLWLSEMGIKRVVLARELSIEEISEIHKAVPNVELEVFVHGALCVSYSGQCYASQYCFKRSANRGECSQICRMEFDLKDSNNNIIEKSKHLLSLRDMAQLNNMERLVEAGAVSFKIEGRLKDCNYVKNITAAYNERLNQICRHNPNRYQRASMGHCKYTFTPDIHKSFNRGFTTYFADGRQSHLASFDTPKAIGEPVGRIKEFRGNSFNVSTTSSFNNGDGLCFFDQNKKLIGFRVNKAEGNRLYPLSMPKELKRGTLVYRNHDQAFESILSKPSAQRKVMITMNLKIKKTELILTIIDEHGNTHCASLPYKEQTANKPQEENIRKQLSKLGATTYESKEITIDSDILQPFIASSQLAELRRMATEHSADTTVRIKQEINNPKPIKDKYPLPYLYNAANNAAKDFYNKIGIKATSFERKNDAQNDNLLIMKCRYCIKAELGYCTKTGRKAPWREPLTLHLGDGKIFTLKFNCKNCEMEVYA